MKKGYVQLDEVKVNKNRVEYYFSTSKDLEPFFKFYNSMFIEYDENIEAIPLSILVIPFVANIMPLMWITNSVLWVRCIDSRYYNSLYRVRDRYQDMYYNYKLGGTLIAAKVVENKYDVKRSSALLFSGGLDAISTSIRIANENPMLINIYGWYNDCIEQNDVFDSDEKNIYEFARNNKLDKQFVKSNFATIINANKIDQKYKKKIGDSWWHGFQHGMCFIGHAIPLAYKYNIEKIYIASSFTMGGERKSCASDPAVDIEVKFASGRVIHDGIELSRQDKVKLVVQRQKELNDKYILKVCSFNEKNCCKCEKCFRTILGLVAEGVSRKELSKFGFNEIDTNLYEYYTKVMNESIHLFGIERESKIHWPDIKKRMISNKDNIIEKEFVEWFLNYNFISVRKKAIMRYRIKNIVPIIKRKILGK